ncbi:MAG: RpiB/LacA/LacB family sugar-phosphate isomerase [Cyclobacteriaceae bacterium]
MIIGIAADHGGFALKEKVKDYLKKTYQLKDFGAEQYDAEDDYPDMIHPLALAVAHGEIDKGIAICGSGVGACMVANKIKGVRAALIAETYSAHQGVEHDNMNVICLGARVTGEALALDIVEQFINARYSGEVRHRRRLDKLNAIEQAQ